MVGLFHSFLVDSPGNIPMRKLTVVSASVALCLGSLVSTGGCQATGSLGSALVGSAETSTENLVSDEFLPLGNAAFDADTVDTVSWESKPKELYFEGDQSNHCGSSSVHKRPRRC